MDDRLIQVKKIEKDPSVLSDCDHLMMEMSNPALELISERSIAGYLVKWMFYECLYNINQLISKMLNSQIVI